MKNAEIDLKLENGIVVDAVWPNDLIFSQNADDTSNRKIRSIDQELRNLAAYFEFSNGKKGHTKESDQNMKKMVLKIIVQNFRNTFFVNNIDQLYATNYLLMREVSKEIVNDEVGRLRIMRMKFFKKKARTLERDQILFREQAYFLKSIINHSYLIETTTASDQLVIKKEHLNKILVNWNNSFKKSIEQNLRKRENLYLVKIDDANSISAENHLNRQLIHFYFNCLLNIFKKIVGSKLVIRNSSFISELDTFARFISYANVDSELMFHKIEADIEDNMRSEVTSLEEKFTLIMESFQDKKKVTTKKVIEMIEREKEDKTQLIKEIKAHMLSEDTEIRKDYDKSKFKISVPLYSYDEYYNYISYLNSKLLILKSFIHLKTYTERKKLKNINFTLYDKIEEREKLNYKLEELMRDEKYLKEEILNSQKKISKFEIQNNLLRKDIHNSQFERIKLLKRTNEMKNKLDQCNWEKERKIKTSHLMLEDNEHSSPLKNKDFDTRELKGSYMKSLFAETNYRKFQQFGGTTLMLRASAKGHRETSPTLEDKHKIIAKSMKDKMTMMAEAMDKDGEISKRVQEIEENYKKNIASNDYNPFSATQQDVNDQSNFLKSDNFSFKSKTAYSNNNGPQNYDINLKSKTITKAPQASAIDQNKRKNLFSASTRPDSKFTKKSKVSFNPSISKK